MSMAEHEPDHGHERTAKPQTAQRPTLQPAIDTRSMTGLLLQLQRTAGNAAVNQLLRQHEAQRRAQTIARQVAAAAVPEQQDAEEPGDAAGVDEATVERRFATRLQTDPESRASVGEIAAAGPAPATGVEPSSRNQAAPRSRLLAPSARPPRPIAPPAREGRAAALPKPLGAEQAAPEVADTRLPAVQREMMSYRDFLRATGQVSKTKKGLKGKLGVKETEENPERKNTISGVTGLEALKGARENRGLGRSLGLWNDYDQTNINRAYEAYEAEPSLKTLTALYDTITFWETINAGRPWAKELEFVLIKVKNEIEAEVQAETKKQAGPQAETLDKMMHKKMAGPTLTAQMPAFLREVGVPATYYAQHLAGNADAMDALEAFSTNLQAGHHYDAQKAFKKVEHLDGMTYIRSLFLARFAQQANLEGLVGTEQMGAEGQELTHEEIDAIVTYSGGSYAEMNTQLRGHAMRRDNRMAISASRMQGDQAATMQADNERLDTMKLATSGLNKLPKFQGIAYRMVVNVKKGYLEAVGRGGTLADLAFQSASPSMTGVGNYAENTQETGSKSLYFMIHTHTAANIVGISGNVNEGEVLFRPGTRFKVMAVWEHIYGEVPPNAPPQVQMILHAQGKYKSEKGLTWEKWEQRKGNSRESKEKFEMGQVQVKVIELIEV